MKRIISLLLLFSMISVVFVSCASNNDSAVTTAKVTEAPKVTEGNTQETENGSSLTETPVTETKAEDPFKGKIDLAQEEYVILCEDRTEALSTFDEFYADEMTGDSVEEAVRERYLTVEENLNVKIKSVSKGNNRKKIGTMLQDDILTGTGEYDICAIGYSLPDVFSEKYLYDLTTVTSINLDAPYWDQNVNSAFRMNGKQYVAAGDFSFIHMLGAMVIYFNKDVVERNSIPDIYKLVRDGEWTIDKLHEYAILCAKEETGDDNLTPDDLVGFVGENTAMTYFYNALGNILVKNDSKTFILNDPDDRADRSIKAYQSLISDKLCSLRDTAYSEWPTAAFSSGKIAFLCDTLLRTFHLRSMEADFGVVPIPRLDTDQKDYRAPINYYWATYAVIPYSVSEPEKIGYVIDALAYYGRTILKEAVYDKSFGDMKLLRDTDSAEMTDLIMKSTVYDAAWTFDFGGCRSILTGLAASPTSSFSSQYKKSKTTIGNDITKTLDLLFPSEKK